ncbi:MAG: hypothetical protein JWN14_703 [Chthonomonadales bacterium]|nr:hypothetical protein [Chthonomonadales bacterium]
MSRNFALCWKPGRIRRRQQQGDVFAFATGGLQQPDRGCPFAVGGWIVLIEWNHKHGRYGYYIEVTATNQPRKIASNRYWNDDLQFFVCSSGQ